MADPVPMRILQDLETTLGLPDGGSSYFFDIQKVLIPGLNEFEILEFPGIAIIPEGTVDDDTELLSEQTTRWNILLIAALNVRTDADDQILKLIADVFKALMIDPQRGGNAIDTKWRGWTPAAPSDDADMMTWAEIRIQVHFRTSDTDMTVSR